MEDSRFEFLVCSIADKEVMVTLPGPGALQVHGRIVMAFPVCCNDAEDARRCLRAIWPLGCLQLQQQHCQHTERAQHRKPVKRRADQSRPAAVRIQNANLVFATQDEASRAKEPSHCDAATEISLAVSRRPPAGVGYVGFSLSLAI